MENKNNKPKSTFSDKTRKKLSKLPKFNKEKIEKYYTLTEFKENNQIIKL